MSISTVFLLASVRGREAAKVTDSFVIGQGERGKGGVTVRCGGNRGAGNQ